MTFVDRLRLKFVLFCQIMLQRECFTTLLLAIFFANAFASDEQQVIFFHVFLFFFSRIFSQFLRRLWDGMRLRDQGVLLQRECKKIKYYFAKGKQMQILFCKRKEKQILFCKRSPGTTYLLLMEQRHFVHEE